MHKFLNSKFVLLLASLLILLVVVLNPLGSSRVSADSSAPTLSPNQGPVGTRVTASANDWIGCTNMSVSGWGMTLASGTINSSGAFSLAFTVPSSAPVGATQLQFSPICSHITWMPFVTFTVTSGSAPDTTPPSVSWTSPVGNGGTYITSSGTVTLQASASDNIGVVKVKFFRWDAVDLKWVDIATVTTPPLSSSIAVSSLNNSYNQINVQAWDAAGNASVSPHIWINRVAAPWALLRVPFATQMGSAGDPNSGSNNCGPASITMAILYYGGSTTVQSSAIAIRGYNNSSNGPTDFKLASTISWLANFSLAEKNVSTFDQVKQEISVGRPVVILVNNNAYRYLSPPPYPNNNNGWFTTSHIVVVTAFDATNVYINDPLRSTADYPIPIATFQNAASTANGSSTTSWYAASIYKP